MLFEEIDTEESTSSLSEVSSLDDDLDGMHLESGSSVEEMSDDEMDSSSWNEIKSESYAEFMENRGLVEEVASLTEDNTIDLIDCYRHFITDEIIDLMSVIAETDRRKQAPAQKEIDKSLLYAMFEHESVQEEIDNRIIDEIQCFIPELARKHTKLLKQIDDYVVEVPEPPEHF
ncbi:unnamed protein product [Didymodactylos carnosus]|uniref:Uncharacterized protein n=1 Tax=Didymodactylos carnosus TaxID=1234261 RepID=A0A815F1V6_9BILA|nr:unnamed protein product [Didymodactylos carnosus]CAF1323198.1 unnamed protein product [Didymodactylos carnosus]CAF3797471.1 unnamed protein product [Didymodactylos carnosus]CAF4171068.1 unnamed protein product [Didymodactylos carnosus]